MIYYVDICVITYLDAKNEELKYFYDDEKDEYFLKFKGERFSAKTERELLAELEKVDEILSASYYDEHMINKQCC